MKKAVASLALVSMIGLQLPGCVSTTDVGKWTVTGAATGAVVGGVVGEIVGDTKGAIIGGLAGAFLGAVIGNYYDKQIASRDEAVKKYNYKAEGERIEIEKAVVSPKEATPGSTVETSVQYTVLIPIEEQTKKITETRIIAGENERIELAKREIERAQGTHFSTYKFELPKDISRGDYTLITIISDGKQKWVVKNSLRVI